MLQVLCGQGQVSVADRIHWTFHIVLYYRSCIVVCKSVWILNPPNPVDCKVRWWDDISLDIYSTCFVEAGIFLYWLSIDHQTSCIPVLVEVRMITGAMVRYLMVLFLDYMLVEICNLLVYISIIVGNCFSIFLVFKWQHGTLQWLRWYYKRYSPGFLCSYQRSVVRCNLIWVFFCLNSSPSFLGILINMYTLQNRYQFLCNLYRTGPWTPVSYFVN